MFGLLFLKLKLDKFIQVGFLLSRIYFRRGPVGNDNFEGFYGIFTEFAVDFVFNQVPAHVELLRPGGVFYADGEYPVPV